MMIKKLGVVAQGECYEVLSGDFDLSEFVQSVREANDKIKSRNGRGPSMIELGRHLYQELIFEQYKHMLSFKNVVSMHIMGIPAFRNDLFNDNIFRVL